LLINKKYVFYFLKYRFCKEIADLLTNSKNLMEIKEEVDRLKEFFLTNYRVEK